MGQPRVGALISRRDRFTEGAGSYEIRAFPYGHPADGSDAETIRELPKRKSEVSTEILRRDGVAVFQSTIGLIGKLRRCRIKVAVVSASRNHRSDSSERLGREGTQ